MQLGQGPADGSLLQGLCWGASADALPGASALKRAVAAPPRLAVGRQNVSR